LQASSHLGPLYDHVRHQIAYLESTGDLVAGEVNVEDVVDTVLLRAFREFSKGAAGREVGSWLIELADQQLGREVRRSKAERRTNVHIEKDIPEVPPVEEVKTLGEEIFEYYQPDEDLKLEDIFPDMDVSSPEDFVAAKEELLRCINAALAGMPRNGGVPCACATPKASAAKSLPRRSTKTNPRSSRFSNMRARTCGKV
jgi:DNA-directed RNA polymerase specialized sigma24 family protein